jgi:hypothetical protein
MWQLTRAIRLRRVAFGSPPYSGQSQKSLTETLTQAGSTAAKLIAGDKGFSALTTKL